MQLSDFSVLSFDCYGTLIDWEGGMLAGLRPLTEQLHQPLSDDAILEAHARYESTQQRQTPSMAYADLLAVVYQRLAEEWHLAAPWDACVAYGQSVRHWPAFPDSCAALHYLKQHYKLVILSNVDRHSFAASNAKLGVDFDAVYTAQDVGRYKPDDANFTYMLRNLENCGIAKSAILHTAESMFHDHQPANRHGLRSCWIYRRHQKQGFGATMHPGEMPHYDFQFTSLADMAEAHRQQSR